MPRVVDVEQRRTELTDAAARVIARSGIEAATMREVAAEAGWTTGALTHYFADKRELLLTTFQASLANRRALRPSDDDLPGPVRLRLALAGVLPVDADRQRHWLVTIACCSYAAGDPEIAAAQADAYREHVGRIARLAVAAGIATDADATERAAELITLANGVAIQALFDPAGWPAERQRSMLDSLLDRAGLPTPVAEIL